MAKKGRPVKYDTKRIKQIAKDLDKYIQENKKYPTIEEFLLKNNLVKDTFYRLVKKDKELSDVLEKVRYTQIYFLVNGGLSGKLNSAFAKFILSAKHDFIETAGIQHSGNINIKGAINWK